VLDVFLLVVCLVFLFAHFYFFFSSRRRHTRSKRDWSSDVCSSDLRYASPHLPSFRVRGGGSWEGVARRTSTRDYGARRRGRARQPADSRASLPPRDIPRRQSPAEAHAGQAVPGSRPRTFLCFYATPLTGYSGYSWRRRCASR